MATGKCCSQQRQWSCSIGRWRGALLSFPVLSGHLLEHLIKYRDDDDDDDTQAFASAGSTSSGYG